MLTLVTLLMFDYSSIGIFEISTIVFFHQDFGYVQTTSTEVLKSYVFNEPIVVDAVRLQPLSPAAIFMVCCRLINHIL